MSNQDLEIVGSEERPLYYKLLPMIVPHARYMIEREVRAKGWIKENDHDSFSWIDAEGISNNPINQLFFVFKRRLYSVNVSLFDGDPMRPLMVFGPQSDFCYDYIVTQCFLMVFLGGVNDELRNIDMKDPVDFKILTQFDNVIFHAGTEDSDFLLNNDLPLEAVAQICVTDKITFESEEPLPDNEYGSGDDFVSRNITHRDKVTRYLKFAIPVPILNEIRAVNNPGHGVNFYAPLHPLEEVAYSAQFLNNPEAWAKMAYRLYSVGRLNPTCLKFLEYASEGGFLYADFLRAYLYVMGLIEDGEPVAGFEMLKQLVVENPDVSYIKIYLAECYMKGRATKKDLAKAKDLYEKSGNDPRALFGLAVIHGLLDEENIDLDKAREYLVKADEQVFFENCMWDEICLYYENLYKDFEEEDRMILALLDKFIGTGDEWSIEFKAKYLERKKMIFPDR